MAKFIVMDGGHQEFYGPFDNEASAQKWCDVANKNNPIKTDKWEHHVFPLMPPMTPPSYS